jgi:hypothetical protein
MYVFYELFSLTDVSEFIYYTQPRQFICSRRILIKLFILFVSKLLPFSIYFLFTLIVPLHFYVNMYAARVETFNFYSSFPPPPPNTLETLPNTSCEFAQLTRVDRMSNIDFTRDQRLVLQ